MRVFIILGIISIILLFVGVLVEMMFDNQEEGHDINEDNENYEVPHLKELTEEQIEDIHSRGKITPEEKLKEWEDLDLCAPGDAIGGAAWRCHKFRNCHDCLIDYANTQDEYKSFYDDLKIISNNKEEVS